MFLHKKESLMQLKDGNHCTSTGYRFIHQVIDVRNMEEIRENSKLLKQLQKYYVCLN